MEIILYVMGGAFCAAIGILTGTYAGQRLSKRLNKREHFMGEWDMEK